jgi:hypothetical protein
MTCGSGWIFLGVSEYLWDKLDVYFRHFSGPARGSS